MVDRAVGLQKAGMWQERFAAVSLLILSAVPLISIIADRSPALISVIVAVAAVLAMPAQRGAFRARLRTMAGNYSLVLALSFGLLIWAWLGLLWSLDASYGIKELVRSSLLLPFGIILYLALPQLVAAFEKDWLKRAMIAIFTVGVVFLAIDPHLGIMRGLTGENRLEHYHNFPAILTSVFLWPILLMLWQKNRALAVGLYVLTIVAVLQTISVSAQLVVVLGGLGVVILYLLRSHIILVGLVIALSFYVLMIFAGEWSVYLPETVHKVLANASIYHRIEIWQSYFAGIMERPILGWGFDASRLPQREGYVDGLGAWAATTSHHPHNLSLALWFELGLPGLILGAVALVIATLALRNEPYPLQMIGVITLLGILLHCGVGKHIWQSAWVMPIFLLALFIAILANSQEGKARA